MFQHMRVTAVVQRLSPRVRLPSLLEADLLLRACLNLGPPSLRQPALLKSQLALKQTSDL